MYADTYVTIWSQKRDSKTIRLKHYDLRYTQVIQRMWR